MKQFRFCLLVTLLFVTGHVLAEPTLYIDDANGVLGKVDVQTGVATVIGSTRLALTDIAFAPNGKLYGLSFTGLYLINPQTAVAKFIGPHGIPGGNALVFGSDGTLYGMGNGDTYLYEIDVQTGRSFVLADIGSSAAGDLAFNGGQLYLSSTDNQLIQIDPSTFLATVVGGFGFTDVYGLATGDNGVLYGVADTQIFSVDTSTGLGTLLVDYGGQGLAAANGTSFITEALPVITSALTANAQVGQSFSYQISAANAPGAYEATDLPPGLSIDATTGVIFGVPTGTGTYDVTLSVTNVGGGSATATLILTVAPADVPVITTPIASSGAQAGVYFLYSIAASNLPTSFAASGLPDGLTFAPATGQIYGIPRQSGTFTITVSATNSGGTSSGTLILDIAPPALPVVTISADIPHVIAGTGGYGEFYVVRSTYDLSAPLKINYKIKGAAVGGKDYVLLKGSKKIKKGKYETTIRVFPLGEGPGPGVVNAVKLVLAPGDGYTIGTASKARVKIYGQ